MTIHPACALVFLLALGSCVSGKQHACDTLTTNPGTQVDISAIWTMEPVFDEPLMGEKKYLVLVYLRQGSCTYCVSETLGIVESYFPQLMNRTDFLLVGEGMPSRDLRRLRKAGMASYPIGIETELKLGIHSDISINLVDVAQGSILISFTPELNPDMGRCFTEFFDQVKQQLKRLPA